MRKIIFLISTLLLLLSLIGAKCNITLPQGTLPTETTTPQPTITPTPTITVTPVPTPLSTVFQVLSYLDSSGHDPVIDGYISAREKETEFVVEGTAPVGHTIEAKLIYKTIEEIPIGTPTADAYGTWSVQVTPDKWRGEGYYELVFTDTETGAILRKEVIVDTILPIITISAGYAKSIRDYGFTITQEAEHIICKLADAGELITANWEVYVKVGSAIVIKQNGTTVATVEFQNGESTYIREIPGVVIEVDNSIPHDETLKLETVAPTWGDGFFLISFNDEVKIESIPQSSSNPITTGESTGCTITVSTAGNTYAVAYMIPDAEAEFPSSGSGITSGVYYVVPSTELEDKVGWSYSITLQNIEDKAGNVSETLSTQGTIEEYTVWR